MMGWTLYGIPNCDTVKKARSWLAERGTIYAFHDYKKAGVDGAALDRWIASAGWETLVNRSGTTFRKLAEADKANLDAKKARALMIAQPSIIKRPVMERGDKLLIGFDPTKYEAAGL